MNKNIQRLLRKKQQKIESRLAQKKRNAKGAMLNDQNIKYELANRIEAISYGGVGLAVKLMHKLNLPEAINDGLNLFKIHNPYFEADHVQNIALNAFCGGQTLDDIEIRRNDVGFLNAIGAKTIPDPTTAGDFCRRFKSGEEVLNLQRIINDVRLQVWQQQPKGFFDVARLDADGTIVSTDGECKQGMDMSYKGEWGYHPLVVSLANTQEPLFIVNRPGNRPSHEGAAACFDESIALTRKAGFKKIILRGDTDFSQTAHLDRWDDDNVTFVFGMDASITLKQLADFVPEQVFDELVRAFREIKTEPRAKKENVKEKIVEERGYRNIRLISENVAEFEYQPAKCDREYRVVVLRKNLEVREKGMKMLFPEVRYFFYITNDREMTTALVVSEANKRCNQENLLAQLSGGVRALRAPLHNMESNWAYMVMTALAWSLKAWIALTLPCTGRNAAKQKQEKEQLLKMEFRRFAQYMIQIPCQIIHTGRRIIYRILHWNPWLHTFFRLADYLTG